MGTKDQREPFSGRYFGIFNVEGNDPEPVAMFRSRDDAEVHLVASRSLPTESQYHLSEYHQIFPADVVGVWWNWYEPETREPLAPSDVMAAYRGEG